MKTKLLVIYVGVANIRSEDISDYIHKVAEKITPKTFKGEVIFIPTQSTETRVECIDPKYITDVELIKEHLELMKDLNEKLNNQINQINNNK